MRTAMWSMFSVVFASFAPLVAADDAVLLKYKLSRGDKLIYRSKSEMKQTQNVGGTVQENEMHSEGVNTYTVDEIDDKGNYHVTVKGERLKVRAKIGALGEFQFDSQSAERDKSSMLGAALTPLYERLSGGAYQAVISPSGKVIEVNGYATLIKDLVEGNSLTAQFAGGGTDDAAREGLREIFPTIEKSKVQQGESWDVPYELSMGKVGVVKGKTVYKYVGSDKAGDRATAKLSVGGQSSIELDIDMGGVKVTGTLTTTGVDGTVQFDVESGRMHSNQSSITISGTINVNANGMDIPIQNEQTVKSSTEYLSKLPN